MNAPVPIDFRLPRDLHPGAWWLWALGLAIATSRTSNPLILCLIAAVAGLVVAARRTDAPWARAYGVYLRLGLLIIVVRVLFRIVLGGGFGTHVLFELPTIPLPGWAAGVSLGGPVTAESVLAAVYDGLRLAVMIACIGAANALANPKRLLRSTPRALHDIGSAIVVAVSLAPQIIDSIHRVRRARRLRGGSHRGLRRINRTLVPVLEDALERSMALAAAMETRGYGRAETDSPRRRRTVGAVTLLGLCGLAIGSYGILDGTAPPALGAPLLVLGSLVAIVGLRLAGRQNKATRYRPDPWRRPEWVVTASGVAALAGVIAAGIFDAALLHPSLQPLMWPHFSVIATVGVLCSSIPAWLSPPLRVEPDEPADVPRRSAMETV